MLARSVLTSIAGGVIFCFWGATSFDACLHFMLYYTYTVVWRHHICQHAFLYTLWQPEYSLLMAPSPFQYKALYFMNKLHTASIHLSTITLISGHMCQPCGSLSDDDVIILFRWLTLLCYDVSCLLIATSYRGNQGNYCKVCKTSWRSFQSKIIFLIWKFMAHSWLVKTKWISITSNASWPHYVCSLATQIIRKNIIACHEITVAYQKGIEIIRCHWLIENLPACLRDEL